MPPDRFAPMQDPSNNVFAVMLERVQAAKDALIAAGVLPAGTDGSRIVVEPPRETTHGDMATNAAMVLAKHARKKPRELAAAIAECLREDDLIDKVEVAGPGFINLTLKPAAWIDALRAVLREGPAYGRSGTGGGTPVNVEYVSANPALCMSGIAGAPCLAMRLPICSRWRASGSRANTTSTMRERRWTRSRSRRSCATGRRWAKPSLFRMAYTPGTISSRSGPRLRPSTAGRSGPSPKRNGCRSFGGGPLT